MAVASGWPLDPLLTGVFHPAFTPMGEQNQIVVNVTYCSRLYDYFFLIKKIWGLAGLGEAIPYTALIPRGLGV
jgi:hypothetical protein